MEGVITNDWMMFVTTRQQSPDKVAAPQKNKRLSHHDSHFPPKPQLGDKLSTMSSPQVQMIWSEELLPLSWLANSGVADVCADKNSSVGG